MNVRERPCGGVPFQEEKNTKLRYFETKSHFEGSIMASQGFPKDKSASAVLLNGFLYVSVHTNTSCGSAIGLSALHLLYNNCGLQNLSFFYLVNAACVYLSRQQIIILKLIANNLLMTN